MIDAQQAMAATFVAGAAGYLAWTAIGAAKRFRGASQSGGSCGGCGSCGHAGPQVVSIQLGKPADSQTKSLVSISPPTS